MPRERKMQKIFRMDKTRVNRADHVALHDGVHDHVGRRTSLLCA